MIHVQDTVRVVRFDDEFADSARLGHTGVVTSRIVNDHGSKPRDPLLVVRFPDGTQDAFWETELSSTKETQWTKSK